MTNYMGKRRLEKILMKLLPGKLQAQAKSERSLMKYSTYRGMEWLKAWLGEYRFEVSADYSPCKMVSFTVFRDDGVSAVMSQYERILTKYNENFEPLPLATWFSGGVERRKRGYFPFQPERGDEAYNAEEAAKFSADDFVCYDIARRKS